jgi:hypothetical protein
MHMYTHTCLHINGTQIHEEQFCIAWEGGNKFVSQPVKYDTDPFWHQTQSSRLKLTT